MSRGRRPSKSGLKRTTGNRSPKTTYRFYCEGSITETAYINGLKSHPSVKSNAHLKIDIAGENGVPRVLIEKAIDHKTSEVGVDHYWAVFDVEQPSNHPDLPLARRLAEQHGINCAISNPCFEVWLLLHVKDVTGPMTSKSAAQAANGEQVCKGKSIDMQRLLPNIENAAIRAAHLTEKHEKDGTAFPNNNPSTNFNLLVERLGIVDANLH